MPKDFDDIYKKLDQNSKSNQKDNNDTLRAIDEINKDNDKILKDINDIKKEIKNMSFKVDTMLEILNNFTIMLAEAEEDDLEDEYELDSDTDESWVPKEDDFWENDIDESI